MKHLIFFLSSLLFLPAYTAFQDKTDISQELLGTWVYEPGKSDDSFRYRRREALVKNVRGLIFHENGKVIIYSEFGCQMPPYFKERSARWRVKNKRTIIIDDPFLPEDPRRMKIIEINNRVLRFEWI